MTTQPANIESVLEAFLRYVGTGRAEATQTRYRRVIDHLHQYLDSADVAFWLGTEPAELIACEREFEADHAMARIFGMDELLCVLPGFLAPLWLMGRPADARTQVSLIDRMVHTDLVRGLAQEGHLGCVIHDCVRAVRDARAELALRSRTRR